MDAKGLRDRGDPIGYGFVIAVVIVALLLTYNGVKIVREYQRLVVFRLGRSFGPRGPGIVYLIPGEDLRGRQDRGHQHDEPPVPGGPESPRSRPRHEVRVPDGVHQTTSAVRGWGAGDSAAGDAVAAPTATAAIPRAHGGISGPAAFCTASRVSFVP